MNCRHRSIHQFTHDGKYNSIIFRRMKSNFKPGSYYNIIAVTCMNKKYQNGSFYYDMLLYKKNPSEK